MDLLVYLAVCQTVGPKKINIRLFCCLHGILSSVYYFYVVYYAWNHETSLG